LHVTFEEGNHDLKNLFKGAAIRAVAVAGLSRSSTRLLLPKE
jgi:hypothetical protein